MTRYNTCRCQLHILAFSQIILHPRHITPCRWKNWLALFHEKTLSAVEGILFSRKPEHHPGVVYTVMYGIVFCTLTLVPLRLGLFDSGRSSRGAWLTCKCMVYCKRLLLYAIELSMCRITMKLCLVVWGLQ